MKFINIIIVALPLILTQSNTPDVKLKLKYKAIEEGYRIAIKLKNKSFKTLVTTDSDLINEEIMENGCSNRGGYYDFLKTGSTPHNNEERGRPLFSSKPPSTQKLWPLMWRKVKFDYRFKEDTLSNNCTCDFIYRVFDERERKGIKYTIRMNRDTVYLAEEREINYFTQWEEDIWKSTREKNE